MTTDALILATSLRLEGGRWVYRGPRPDPACHAHGVTSKQLPVLMSDRVVELEVFKQRWLWPDGHTTHDRPPQDVSWSRYGLLVVFSAVWAWLSSERGLHHVAWPWGGERPSRRSVQRWLSRLLEDGLAWQQAIRSSVVDGLVPRLMEEQYPAGIPPPGGLGRFKENGPRVDQLCKGLALLHSRSMPIPSYPSALLPEARRRFERSRKQ